MTAKITDLEGRFDAAIKRGDKMEKELGAISGPMIDKMNPVGHTPEPWAMDGPTLKGNGYNIGSVNSCRSTEGEANARLIAAAPELYRAAVEILRACEKGSSHEVMLAKVALAAAIDKAESK